ncbi:hypothetical protein EUBSIR_02113 [[Eubacterium] siraeum DSM 15702]|uniref:Uncharacterized protein n=1 Tax=[Eubacterium] siraeum DSM 15702 TaxID=428128 RepID=B0MQJ8_9FIRM|nr:hypothetical protein EUBSIR_02113 [[Eubacterium] siraeum DSM 15702]
MFMLMVFFLSFLTLYTSHPEFYEFRIIKNRPQIIPNLRADIYPRYHLNSPYRCIALVYGL